MKKILFNNINNSFNYTKNFELLFSDYELFRKKYYSNKCLDHLSNIYNSSELFLTHSATGALEMVASLIEIKNGDEVIMPSFTFVSTANAFVSKGAIPVFIDIEPKTLNVDCSLIEQAITPKTKAIIAVHYAGHACNMEVLKQICEKHQLYLIEDAAMAFGNSWQGKPLGSIGHFSVISFDITKQITAIQGGLLLVNDDQFKARASQIYHIGTNRTAFQKNNVPYYEWVDIGSKYQMNELNAAVLFEQLQKSSRILEHRNQLSKFYYTNLIGLQDAGFLRILPLELLDENVHEFYIILNSLTARDALSKFLNEWGIESLFHYIPLHNSRFGNKISRFVGGENTVKISQQILRLPLNNEMTEQDVIYVAQKISDFFYAQ